MTCNKSKMTAHRPEGSDIADDGGSIKLFVDLVGHSEYECSKSGTKGIALEARASSGSPSKRWVIWRTRRMDGMISETSVW